MENIGDFTDPIYHQIKDTDDIITAEEARRLKDVQGIDWKYEDVTREDFRKERLKDLMSDDENDDGSVDKSDDESVHEDSDRTDDDKSAEESANDESADNESTEGSADDGSHATEAFYEFRQYTKFEYYARASRSDMIYSTSKHDVYVARHSGVFHWMGLTFDIKTNVVLDSRESIVPSVMTPETFVNGFTNTWITTMSVEKELLIVGGTKGELICKRLNNPEDIFCFKINAGRQDAAETEAIVNAIEIFQSPRGSIRFMASNKSGIEHFNAETFQLLDSFTYGWEVKRTSISPDGQSLLVVGNNRNAKLVDAHTRGITKSLPGHSNDVISCTWHPGGNILATGSEDKTCHIWDIRKESESLAVLKGNIGGITSIRFTSDGQFMAMAETADFVHIYDVNQDFDQNQKQEVDFFGDITGVSFSPDTESLFIGVAPHYMFKNTTLLCYNRHRNFNYYQHFQNQMGF